MLPYQNLREAEEAQCRALSFAEKFWFRYSADKPDYILHYHNILFLMVFYTLAPLPYVFIGLGWFKNMDRYKIQPKVKDSFSNMLKCYKNVMSSFLLVVGPLQVISYPTIKWIGIRTSLPLPSLWEVFLQIMVYFIIEDFGNYWIHRLLHSKLAYEKIHRIHHEYVAPIGLAAPYAHWAEILILGIPAFLAPALVPGHIVTYWLWFVLRQMEAIETHSGHSSPKKITDASIVGNGEFTKSSKNHSAIEQKLGKLALSDCRLPPRYNFPWSPTKYIPFYGGAEYHDYHHFVGQQSQSNFASVFTYCDYIYGTDKGYKYKKQALEKLAKLRHEDDVLVDSSPHSMHRGEEGKYHISTEDRKSQ